MARNGLRIQAGFAELEEEALAALEKEWKSLAFEFLSRVVQLTPVDTGRAKGSWGLVDSEPDASANGTVSVNQDGIRVIYLYNNVPYVVALEYGHSQAQAPAGMIRLAAAQLGLTVSGNIGEDL